MTVLAFLIPFVLIGTSVIFIAFWGGPGAAREAYLTRGSRAFRIGIPVLYIVLGVVVPALVLSARGETAGGNGHLQDVKLTESQDHGKILFRQQCASCHTLKAVDARGVTGPNLDQLGQVKPQRVLNAIKIGGTGQLRMPSGLLSGQDAQDVANYVSKVAGQN
jgi:cytochrome c553